jgi:hypothetical protein
MADRLDILLEHKRREERDLVRRLNDLRLVIETLEEGAGLTPERPRAPPTQAGYSIDLSEEHPEGSVARKSGRQKGAISKTWLAIFQEMVQSGHANSAEEIRRFAFAQGLNLTEKSARTRARDHLKAGFFEVRDDGYWVTKTAIEKFKLLEPK